MQQIDTGQEDWRYSIKILLDSSNLICITKDEFKTSDFNPLIWLGTNLTQYLASLGDTEICPLFGKQINNIDDFAYQLCRTIPWGFEMGRNRHAIYDVMLNFATQPKNRYFIWHDAQNLFTADRELFDNIFESLIVASYLNTKGRATHDYQVNQKVVFLFDNTSEDNVLDLCDKVFYTPSIFDNFENQDEYNIRHRQLLVAAK